jgi:hypothetical protein
MSSEAALESAILGGLRYVAAQLGPSGQWPSRRHARADLADEGRHEISPFVTGLGVLTLAAVDHPLAQTIRRRSRKHLAGTIQPPGLWRYFLDLPLDADTSSIAALALGPDHPWLAERRNVPPLLDARADDGRFRLWLRPGKLIPGEIDAVANANVVAVLGERPETERAVRWIGEVVEDGQVVESSWYYRDSLDLALAVQRAADAGVSSLARTARVSALNAAARIEDKPETLSTHRLAQAVVAASWEVSASASATLLRARLLLLARQRPDGSWPAGLLYVGPHPPGPPTLWWSSTAVTSSICTAALAVA